MIHSVAGIDLASPVTVNFSRAKRVKSHKFLRTVRGPHPLHPLRLPDRAWWPQYRPLEARFAHEASNDPNPRCFANLATARWLWPGFGCACTTGGANVLDAPGFYDTLRISQPTKPASITKSVSCSGEPPHLRRCWRPRRPGGVVMGPGSPARIRPPYSVRHSAFAPLPISALERRWPVWPSSTRSTEAISRTTKETNPQTKGAGRRRKPTQPVSIPRDRLRSERSRGQPGVLE